MNQLSIGNSTQKKQKFYWDGDQNLIFINIPPDAEIKKINKLGQVAGNYKTTDGSTHGFFWDRNYGLIDLGTLGGKNSWVTDMNDYGEIVGFSESQTSQKTQQTIVHHGFLWQNGIMTDLHQYQLLDSHTKHNHMISSSHSRATGINNLGKIAGYISDTGTHNAFSVIWEDNKVNFIFDVSSSYHENGKIPVSISENNTVLLTKPMTSRLRIYVLDLNTKIETFITEIANTPEEWVHFDISVR